MNSIGGHRTSGSGNDTMTGENTDGTVDQRVDSIEDLDAFDSGTEPTIIQISDIHGYLDSARSALRAVGKSTPLIQS